jgi:hypothetical protein
MRCAKTSCFVHLDFYRGQKCEGTVVESDNGTLSYEIEREIENGLFDVKFTFPIQPPTCYGRIKISAERLYFFYPTEYCATPDKRATKINEAQPFNRF